MKRIARTALAVTAVLLVGFGAAACEDDSSQATETKAKEKGYDKLVANQPGVPQQR
ncbi:hypothetical protein [Streptomyces sp. TRM68367]|uniref:hypothetical protein n=1 Tax=Streptomyces sp. TRM68367 TaxID=2758415 RepID=UPI00165CD6A1|nr:hypothetical protein [Streptomyces sp. TRM68367]MBC9723672.1 hypothetical protein [Streptomyces sp. TRM68367]